MVLNRALVRALEAEGKRRDQRKVWIILNGGTLPLVMDAWQLEAVVQDKEILYTLVDYTNGKEKEIRMVVDLQQVAAIKFYEHYRD